jgi:hemerythrin superfamily protein
VAGAAAAGLIAGVAATLGRKAVVQAAEALTGDWFDVLRAEHLIVLEFFDRLELTSEAEPNRRQRLLAKLKAALDKHAFEEENVIYPALRHAAPGGEAQKLYADHAEVKTLIYELETTPADQPTWAKTLQRLRAAVEAHVREEEDEVFPQLRDRLTEDEDARLTAMLHKNGVKLA